MLANKARPVISNLMNTAVGNKLKSVANSIANWNTGKKALNAIETAGVEAFKKIKNGAVSTRNWLQEANSIKPPTTGPAIDWVEKNPKRMQDAAKLNNAVFDTISQISYYFSLFFTLTV